MEVSDKLLHGMAMQACNMVKTELRYKSHFSGLIASYIEGEGLRRMKLIERDIVAKCGPDWIDHAEAKAAVWGIIREAMKVVPIDAFVFASIVDMFLPTPAFYDLPYEEQKQIANGSMGHPRGIPQYFKPCDAISAVAQTPGRVCLVNQKIRGDMFIGDPEVIHVPQSDFKGRMKVFGGDEETPASVRDGKGMSEQQPYIVCPKCGMVSHNPNDVKYRYCGNCHAFHDAAGRAM